MAKKKAKAKKEVSALEVTRQAIIKKYGEGVISPLGDHEDLKIDAISTGCLALDSALGVGGFARGRLYEVYGPNSSGKSTLALSVCMQALKRKMNVAYVDAEHSLDPKLVRNMGRMVGVDPDVIDLVQAFTGDENLEIAETLMKSGELDVMVVDSVSALLPKDMAEGDIGDNYIGQLARLMSKACMKLTPVANRTNTLLIFINQIRHNIGKWGDSRTPTGGEALSFYTTGRIRVEGGEHKKSRLINDEGIVVGHESAFLVVKNKLAAPWRKSKINLIYGTGYDFVEEIVSLSIDFGIIEQAGAWYYYPAGQKTDKWNGRMVISDVFRENEKMYEELRHSVKNLLGLNGE
jgi:recombination protein RecA